MSVESATRALDDHAARLAAPLGVDGPALLRERAEILGIAPQGKVSAGGSCRLMQARDGRWVAINLARRDDVELLAAWMEHDWDGPVWDAVEDALRAMDAEPAVDRAQLLGIPASVAVTPAEARSGARRGRDATPTRSRTREVGLVVDLSTMWAGPLCARLIAAVTRRPVRKVEGTHRPDGARAGPPEFFMRLNGMKEQAQFDFTTPDGRAALDWHLDRAAIVVTSARRRALDQLGIDPHAYVEQGVVWVSITGYGYDDERVAFGDDAAVAGGAAVAAGGPDDPVFVGDAVADPLSGLHGAVCARTHLEAGRAAFIDVSMRDVVADAFV